MTTRTPDVVAGLTTDWIPLTTPGPGPISECSTAIYYLPGAVSGFVAFDPYYGKWIDTTVKCLATEQSLWWNQHSDGGINDINLGPFACPSGYTTAAVSTINPQTSFIGCCPSAYTFAGSFLPAATLGQCHSPLSVGQTIVAKSGFPTSGWQDTTAVVLSTGVSVAGVHVNGYVFQAGVVSTAPASTSASTTQAVSTSTTGLISASNTQAASTPTTSPVSASNTASSFSSSSSGISSGEKIGIGVGISVGLVGICCLIIAFIIVRRRSGPRNSMPPAGIVEAPSYPPNYPPARPVEGSYAIYEAPGKTVDARSVGGEYYDEVSGWSKQHSTPPAEMWVPPSRGG